MWKRCQVAALLLALGSVLFFLIDVGVEIIIQSGNPPETDFTFLNGVVVNTEVLTTKQQIINLAENLNSSNEKFNFQTSELFRTLSSSQV